MSVAALALRYNARSVCKGTTCLTFESLVTLLPSPVMQVCCYRLEGALQE